MNWRLLAAGLAASAAFVALRQVSPADGSPAFYWLLVIPGVAYLVAVRELAHGRTPSRPLLVGCLALALLWRLPLAIAPVGRDADVYRYLWDARIQRAGLSPYTAIPSDPALAWVHTAQTRRLNNPDVPSPYPPVAQWLFRGIAALHESAQAMKLALVGCEALLVLVLWRWLGGRGRDPSWVLAYAWHPLATLEVARNGHFDVVGALFVCLTAVALLRQQRMRAAVWLALGIGTKLLPVVLLPLLWRRVRGRDALAGAAVLGAAAMPFALDGLVPAGSIPAVVERFRFNAPVFDGMHALVGAWGAAVLALAAGLLASAVARWRAPADTPTVWAWPLAIALAGSPLVYPWYLVWLIPLATERATLPLLGWTLSVLPTYAVWYWAPTGAPWRVPPALLVLEYGVPLLLLAWVLRRPGDRPDGSA